MDKKISHTARCFSFASAYELVNALSSLEGSIVSVEEVYIPAKFDRGSVEYTIYFSFVDKGDE